MINNDISICVPFCTLDIIDCVKNLLKQKCPGKREIIVAYDNPEVPLDNKIALFLRKNKIKLIINKKNLGLAATYNVLIRTSRYDNVYLIHEDCIPQKKDLMSNSLKELNSGSDSVVNATTVVPVGVWKGYDFWNKMLTFRHMTGSGPVLAKASLFNKSIFKKIGYFDEKTFKTAGEDIDFCLRMNKSNLRGITVPDIVTHNHHVKRSSFLKVLKKEWQMGEAHGACKRKYGPIKIGRFDLEWRILFLLLFFAGLLFSNFLISLVGALPFVGIPIAQSFFSFRNHKWLLGALIFPFIGFLIILTQTAAGIKGFLTKKQESKYYDNG